MLMPIVAIVGFFVLGLFPTLVVLIVFGCIRRAGEYAISKPAREVLFTVISREEKYKVKNFIDTVMVRGGDAMSGWLFEGLRMLGIGLSGISFVAVPVAVLWTTTAYLLGRRQEQLRAALTAKRRYFVREPRPETPIDPQDRRRAGPATGQQAGPN
jgi:AAA family ATP:ADP antiporter